jgi:lipopolysaccharide export system ATP-binding protein
MAEVRLSGLTKRFGTAVAVAGMDLTVLDGEFFVLLGPTGAGKTTCFYSVMGLVKPDAGRVMLDGEDITGLPMYRRAILGLGYLPQETSIFRGLTIEQNILTVLELAEPNRDARIAKLDKLLDEFGLTRLRDAPAMALLDEPFAGIDPISISDIRDLVCDLKRRGIGVLITDHNVRETLEIVDRAYIIYDGRVLFTGSPDELVADTNVRRLYLGEGFSL